MSQTLVYVKKKLYLCNGLHFFNITNTLYDHEKTGWKWDFTRDCAAW
jgi:hypothetical protein